MHHLKDVRQWIEEGQHDRAMTTIDHLLFLAPHNIEALKLKAFLLRAQGFFEQEEKLWSQILVKDPEDPDGVDYFYSRYMEEREHFYFTDPLPDGRRYLGSSKELLTSAITLFLGSLSFLSLSHILPKYNFFQNFYAQFALFCFLVCGPFAFLLKAYIFSLRHILLHEKGVIFKTLFFSYPFSWEDFESIKLVYDLRNAQDIKLYLFFHPKKNLKKGIQLNLTEEQASIKSRKIFLKEIQEHFGLIGHEDIGSIFHLKDEQFVSF